MSSQDDADLVAAYKNHFLGTCCGIAGSVFLVYEYIISVGDGIKLFWTSRLTGASILYLTNFVIPLIANAVALAGSARMSDKRQATMHVKFTSWIILSLDRVSCVILAQASAAFGFLQYIPWATFSALRVYALSRNLPLGIATLILSIVPFGINMVQFGFGLTGFNDPTFGCLTGIVNLSLALSKNDAVTIVSRICLISADALVLAVTWYNMPRKHHYTEGAETLTFAGILLWNGTVYFVSLLILNVLHLTLTLLAIDLAVENVSYVTLFTEPVTAVLVSRFLLDLQAANHHALRLDSEDRSLEAPTGSLIFNRVVGSLGSSIIPGSFEDIDTGDSVTPSHGPDSEKEQVGSGEVDAGVLEVS